MARASHVDRASGHQQRLCRDHYRAAIIAEALAEARDKVRRKLDQLFVEPRPLGDFPVAAKWWPLPVTSLAATSVPIAMKRSAAI